MHVYPARALERAMKAKEVITRALSGEIKLDASLQFRITAAANAFTSQHSGLTEDAAVFGNFCFEHRQC